MKALVLENKEKIAYKEIEGPEKVGQNSVLVKVAAAGVCGSDLIRYGKGKAYHFPLVLGHEFSAVVEEAEEGSKFKKGDRVAVFPLLPKYSDPYSKIGEYGVSSEYDYFGSRRDGAFSEWLYVPEENLIPIPHYVSLVHAATVEPAAVALHAVLKFDIPANATALVIGAGPIGALAAQWLRILGCSRIIVAEVDKKKCEIMKDLGFEVINADECNTVEKVKELTNGKGVNLAVEGCGLSITFLQTIEVVGVFGQVLLLGDLNGDVTLKDSLVSSILRREVKLYGTWNSKVTPIGNSEWEMVLSHMDKDLNVEALISHTPDLSEGVKLFENMVTRKIWHNKVVFAISDQAKEELKNKGVKI